MRSRLGMSAYYKNKEGGGQDLSPCPCPRDVSRFAARRSLLCGLGAPQPWIPGSVAFDLGSPGPNLKGTVTRKATLRVTGLLISTKCLPN